VEIVDPEGAPLDRSAFELSDEADDESDAEELDPDETVATAGADEADADEKNDEESAE